MNGKDFKKAMANPKNIYVLISTDSAMIDLYSKRFKEAIGADNISIGTIKPYGKLFKHITLNVIYMPKITEEVFNRKEFIFIYTDSIDKRTAVYKKYKDQIIELNNDYVEFVINHTELSEEEARNLIKINNNDFGMIKNAISIYNYSEKRYNRYTDYSSDIYNWVDSFIKKEPLPRCTESPISIMALLSTNCSNLLKIKQNNIVGMNPYVKMNLSKLSSYITEKELVQIINDCFYLDCQIKKGVIDINYVLAYLRIRRYYNATSN